MRGAQRGSATAAAKSSGQSRNLDKFSIDMDRLHGYLGYLLQRAQMLAYADFISEMAELDLRPGQFAVLTVIDANPGLRQSEVSAALGIQKTNFVAAITNIERRGLAVRKSVAGDKRSYAL